MIKKLFASLLVIVFISSASAAIEPPLSSQEKQDIKRMVNQNHERIPGFAKPLIRDQVFNLASEEHITGVRMDGLNISELNNGGYSDADLRIEYTEEGRREIMNSDTPLGDIQELKATDKINVTHRIQIEENQRETANLGEGSSTGKAQPQNPITGKVTESVSEVMNQARAFIINVGLDLF